MKVTPINNIYSYKKLSFTSNRTSIYDENGKSLNCHYTNFNREDVNWCKFADFLAERYKEQNKVDINIFGCSDGSEAYTLLFSLEKLPKKTADKFKIHASDISPEMIAQVKNGEILLHEKDINYLNKTDAMKYFSPDREKPVQIIRETHFYPYKIDKKLRNKIDFSVKDIRKEAQCGNFANGVVIFRNGWTFNSLDDQNRIVSGLKHGCNKKSLVMIGQADLFKSDANNLLQKHGFKGIKSDIYTALETDYPSETIGMPKQRTNNEEFILFEI